MNSDNNEKIGYNGKRYLTSLLNENAYKVGKEMKNNNVKIILVFLFLDANKIINPTGAKMTQTGNCDQPKNLMKFMNPSVSKFIGLPENFVSGLV